MRSRNLAALALAAALLSTGTVAVQSASAADLECPREQYRPTPEDLLKYYCGFKELGPKNPENLPAHALLTDYNRTGGLRPGQFLSWYRDGLNWKYPGEDGFVDKDGAIDKAVVELAKDTKLDRFGDTGGRFLSDAGTLYPQRALPPDSLNPVVKDGVEQDSYHCYIVLKPFKVQQGHIAAAFNQPGGGVQQMLDKTVEPEAVNVQNLLDKKFLGIREISECLPA
ncbi:TNT domain-containing protein [Kitasatospora sp. NPDC057692]|uniref:TNT domain-containing protein n=1 Tax=Kitasatospora sp. NPDC057692 TaxID=3346215 RepID=UPI0036A9FF04